MPPLAYFGIESSGLSLVVDLLILFAAVLYLSLIYWTYADARRRIEDPMLVGCAVAASLFPYVGTLVYMVLRPPEYLEDVHERELETQAAEARLNELRERQCPHCDYPIERDFVRCPSCMRKLKERCVSCSRPLDRTWAMCPYCEAENPAAASARRSSRRRATPAGERELTGVGRGAAASPPRTARAAEEASRRAEEASRRGEEEVAPAPLAASEAARNPRGRAGSPSRPLGPESGRL
jgi:hypothetical protein